MISSVERQSRSFYNIFNEPYVSLIWLHHDCFRLRRVTMRVYVRVLGCHVLGRTLGPLIKAALRGVLWRLTRRAGNENSGASACCSAAVPLTLKQSVEVSFSGKNLRSSCRLILEFKTQYRVMIIVMLSKVFLCFSSSSSSTLCWSLLNAICRFEVEV